VVMTGAGAHAAACVGVLRELERRGITPYAVCGMLSGAWPAALFAAGLSLESMEKALHQAARAGRRMLAPMWYERLGGSRMPSGARLNHLLGMQTGQRILSLCPGAALFPCRMTRTGQRVVFSSRAYMQDEGAMLAMQAGAGFAARAAMALPPFLSPLSYMGTALLGESDAAFCCRLLAGLGAQRVMIVCPQVSKTRKPDALDLIAAAQAGSMQDAAEEAQAGLLCVIAPNTAGAADVEKAMLFEQAGYLAAREQLDGFLSRMGMARCRVLPFERRVTVQRR